MADLTPLARTYPHGVTSWVDCGSPDVDASVDFYRGLFGWEFADQLPPGVPGRFVLATLDGLDVASVSDAAGDAAWSTYVAVDDADATTAALVDLGATVTSPPEDAGPGGRDARLSDPQGVELRLWQARRRLGAQVVNTPGAWNFSDLRTSDPGAAAEFYQSAFGWRVVDQGWSTAIQVSGYGDHLENTVDPDIRTRQASAPEGFADVIGSIGQAGEEETPHWHVTFTVEDRDVSADAVLRLGGTVVSTHENDWTRTALVRDVAGAALTLSQFAPTDW